MTVPDTVIATVCPMASNTTLAHRTITPRLGSELAEGTQLVDMSDGDVIALKQLGAERGVIVARDQMMTNEQQVEFGQRLGELMPSPVNKADVPAELLVIHADENSKRAAGEKWHSDVSSEAATPGLSMLRMEQVPESGGDTLFADMRQAFETLSDEMQEFLLRLTARHDPRGHYLYLSGAKRLDELPAAIHPVVRTHPLTGDRALYVNDGFVGKIVELSRREGAALLNMLYDHVAYSVSLQCRVRWEPNTVTFWDNRIVQHHAAFDYWPETRHGYRVTVVGEAPELV